MISYPTAAWEQLLVLVRDEDADAREWLHEQGYRELAEFWDAIEGVERSFKWLMENGFLHFAATVDALNENDHAKVWLLQNGYRELAAFVDACADKKSAVMFLIKAGQKGLVLVAREITLKEKKKQKNFLWGFLNLGNPFS